MRNSVRATVALMAAVVALASTSDRGEFGMTTRMGLVTATATTMVQATGVGTACGAVAVMNWQRGQGNRI